jgi:hypothetical protein
MRTFRRFGICALLCAIYGLLSTTAGLAQGGKQALPPLPAPAVIAKVIAETQGPNYVPLNTAGVALTALQTLATTPLAAAAQQLDTTQAIHYFSLDTGLGRTVMPIRDSRSATLQADTKTPDDQLPAKIVGATFEPGKPVTVLVAVWKDSSQGRKPEEIRFYADGKLISPGDIKITIRKLKGTKKGTPSTGDEGVIIAARETCFNFALDQICYGPKKHTKDNSVAKIAEQADKDLSAVYDIKAKFDTDGALPEVMGTTQRQQCAANLAQAQQLTQSALTNCKVNLIFTGVTKFDPNGPIGLFKVLQDADLKAYSPDGTLVGRLPAGTYVVLDATPLEARSEPGTPGALFLVNANGKDHYLIPSQVVEGFGSSDDPEANDRRGQAGIKDGYIGGQGF